MRIRAEVKKTDIKLDNNLYSKNTNVVLHSEVLQNPPFNMKFLLVENNHNVADGKGGKLKNVMKNIKYFNDYTSNKFKYISHIFTFKSIENIEITFPGDYNAFGVTGTHKGYGQKLVLTEIGKLSEDDYKIKLEKNKEYYLILNKTSPGLWAIEPKDGDDIKK